MSTEPKLYNWVRAIRKISLISAYYTVAVLILGLLFAVYLKAESDASLQVTPNYQLFLTILSTLLLTLGIRNLCIKKLRSKFLANFNYELLLAFWCIVLVLLHLECQLLVLVSATYLNNTLMQFGSFFITGLVLGLTWPKLEKIQSLLKN